MSLILKQINNHVVNAVPLDAVDVRPVKGCDICAEPFANMFLVAKKRSGKTSACFKLLKECTGKDTQLIVFCSTLYKDKNWIAIRKHFMRKGISFTGYTDIFEDGVNHLGDLLAELNAVAKVQEEDEGDEPEPIDHCDKLLEMLGVKTKQEPDEPKKKEKKDKCLAPDYIIVFDDLSHQLRNPIIESILKKNRHYMVKIIINSQWVNDLLPSQRKMMDLWMIFRGMSQDKLKEIWRDADISFSFELFWKIYKKSTKKPYSFLYIDTSDGSMRRNFDTQIILKQNEQE